jgi:hypothetical protein
MAGAAKMKAKGNRSGAEQCRHLKHHGARARRYESHHGA